jgi:hypothetical protein
MLPAAAAIVFAGARSTSTWPHQIITIRRSAHKKARHCLALAAGRPTISSRLIAIRLRAL